MTSAHGTCAGTSTKSGCTGFRTTFLKECFTNSARSKLGWSSSSSFQPTPVLWMVDPNATAALLDLACHKQTGQNCRAAMKKYGDTCDDTTVVRNVIFPCAKMSCSLTATFALTCFGVRRARCCADHRGGGISRQADGRANEVPEQRLLCSP